ncbi:MAG TPA: malonyl-CoA synthase [Caulobacteraceae bacterium]|nr:malonyl-CoA synthase [Caulobacteraceae bacterium]
MTNHLFGQVLQRMESAGRPFIRAPGQAGGEDTILTYGDMLKGSGRLAQALVLHGVRSGDRVAAQVEKSAQAILLYLACIRAGAVWLPLNPAYTLAELDYFIGNAEPVLMVCDPARGEAVGALASRLGVAATETLAADGLSGSLVDLAASLDGAFSDVPRGPDDAAAILYTSGTTGLSKGAVLSHDNLASNSAALAELWRFTADDVLLHALPIFHTHGLFVATNVTLMAGSSMILMPRFDPAEILARMGQASVMMGVPTFYVRLLQSPALTREAAAGMRLFVSGSAPLLEETHTAWFERTGHRILERYGMTETNMNSSNPYDGDRVAGTVGLPLPGVDIRIADPQTGAPLPKGEVGMIEIRGPNVFKGYWRMPDKTAADFRPDGYFISGDLGAFDARGYLRIVGRSKDLVISGGFNVYPKEVEAEIDALAGVLETAVIGLPHPDLGEGVTAVVVLKPGAAVDEDAVRAALADRLAKYKQPKRVLFVEDLPRNAMGKVQKAVLRQTYARLYQD